MNFQFESLSDFWAMSGHGPYVWASYLLMALVIVQILVSPIRKRRRLLAELARQERLAARERQQSGTEPESESPIIQ